MTNDKKSCNDFVHGIRFWKRQSFPNEPRTRLSQSVIPTLHVVGLPAAFTYARMSLFRKNELISFPEIAVALANPIGRWNLFPKFTAGCLTAITDDKCHDLASPTTHDRPDPAFVPSFINKWPHFIGFQHIFGFGRQKCVFKFRVGFVFFLARRPVSDDSHQRCVARRAYWSAHGRQTRFVLSALRCIRVSVQAHRVSRSLCTHIADCHSHYDHFWRCFGYHNSGICTQSVLLSCTYYISNHFNLTTSHIFSVGDDSQNDFVMELVLTWSFKR